MLRYHGQDQEEINAERWHKGDPLLWNGPRYEATREYPMGGGTFYRMTLNEQAYVYSRAITRRAHMANKDPSWWEIWNTFPTRRVDHLESFGLDVLGHGRAALLENPLKGCYERAAEMILPKGWSYNLYETIGGHFCITLDYDEYVAGVRWRIEQMDMTGSMDLIKVWFVGGAERLFGMSCADALRACYEAGDDLKPAWVEQHGLVLRDQ